MDWKILGIAIFAVILFGLIFYYYYEKRDVEGFVATFTPAISVQTDRFLSGGITPTNTTVTGTNTMVRGYSTIRGIQIASYAHIAEISNYYGYDSNWNLNSYAQGYGNTLPFNCTGWVGASQGPGSFNLGASREDQGVAMDAAGDYVRNVWAFGTTRSYITSTKPYTRLHDIEHTRENGPTSSGPGAIDGYNNFLKDMSILLISTTNGFMRFSPYYDSSHVVNHLQDYLGVYGGNMDFVNNGWGGVVAWCDWGAQGTATYRTYDRKNFGGPYGKLSNTLTFPATQVVAANAEALQLNVYGVITDQMLSDFQQCIHWGALFNFTNLSYMETQINVPYYSQLDCMTAYYSHNLFYKEVQPDNANNYAPADGVSPNLITGSSNYVGYNKRIISLLEQATTVANTRIVIPTNYEYNNVVGNHLGATTGSNYHIDNPTTEKIIKCGNIIAGQYATLEEIRACYTFTYGVNPTSSALSNTGDSLLTVLQRQFVGPVTPQILSYMPSMLQRYFTSYIYNRTIAILKNRLNTTVRGMWTLRGASVDWQHYNQGYKSLNITYPATINTGLNQTNKHITPGNVSAVQISNLAYKNVSNVAYYNGYYCWDGVIDTYNLIGVLASSTDPTSYSAPGTISASYPHGMCIGGGTPKISGGTTPLRYYDAKLTNSTSFQGDARVYTESSWTTGEYVGRYYNLNRKGLLLSLAQSNAVKYSSEPAWAAFVNKYGNVGADPVYDNDKTKNGARISGYDYYSLTVDDLQTARLLAYADPTVTAWTFDYNPGQSPNAWFKKGCVQNNGLTNDTSTVAIVEGNNNYATNYYRYYCGYITRNFTTPSAEFMGYLTNLSVKTNLYGLYDDGETVSGNAVTNSNYIPYILQKYDDVAGWTWDGTNLNVILSNINIKIDGTDTGTNAYVDTTTTNTAVNTNKYVWSQSTTTLNVIQKMTDEYLNLLYPKRLLPSHDASFNPVDKLMLNQIAQKYYEYSGGTAEMTFIYDVYPICSNMIDIRFRKQQHYNQASTISLFGSNIPQIETYNRLQDIYNNGTWINSYSNVDAILIDISNALNALEPILNPVYPTVGSGYGNVYDIKKLMNANSNQTVILNGLLGNVVGGLNSNTTVTTTTYSGSTITGVAAAVAVAGTSMLKNIAIYQEQLNSTINADQTLYNYLYGMETSVARVFITNRCIGNPDGSISTFYTDVNSNVSSLITVNGIALGQNAALSYNPAYNGNIEVDMGQSAGNVNYQPTIIYSCNINPVISCSNVEFIQRAAQLYVDSIYTNLSSIVSNSFPYDSNNGELRVDKVLGFYQIDSNTCGFTWQQSVYDIYTNQPSTSIVSVNMPFYYDESIYQTPQLLINNGKLDSNYPAAFTSTSISYPFITSNLTTDFYLDVQNITTNINNLIAPTGLATSIIPISTTFNTITTNINANTNYVSGLSLYNYSGALAPAKAIEIIQNMPLKYYNYVTSNLSSFSTVFNSVYVPTMFNNWGVMTDSGIGATAWDLQRISTLKEFSSVDANFNQIPIITLPNIKYKTTSSIIPSVLGVKNASIYIDTGDTAISNAQTAFNTANTARNTTQTALTNAQTAFNSAQTALTNAQTAVNTASLASKAYAQMGLLSAQTTYAGAYSILQFATQAYDTTNKAYNIANTNLTQAQTQSFIYFTILNNVRYDITLSSPQYTSTPPTTLSGTTSSYTINLVPNGAVSSGSVNPSTTTNKITLSFTINALTSGIGYINIGLLYNTGSGNNYINFSISEKGTSIFNGGPAFAPGTYTISITNSNGTYEYIMTQNGTTVKFGTTPATSYAFFIGGGVNTSSQTITNVSYSLVSASGTTYQTIIGPQPTGATGTGIIPPLTPILTMAYNATRQIVFTITNAPITAGYIIIYCPTISVSGSPPLDPNQYVDYSYYYVNINNYSPITTYTLPAAIQKLMDPTLSYTFTSFAYSPANTANQIGASTTITILPNTATVAGTQYIYNPGTTDSTTYELAITNIYSGIFPQQLESYTYTLSTLFMYPYIDNSHKIPFSYITANISNYSTSLLQLSNSYSNLYAFNSFYKNTNYIPIYKALPYESYLDNANGACPAVNCENSNVMLSLIDQYNNDTDNNDNIVRILKGFTPNGYQCDYLVETIIDAPITPADAIRTGVYNNANMAQNTPSYLYNVFWTSGIPDKNGATPFTTLNIRDPIAKAQFWYAYIAMWANPPIYNITDTLGSTASPATTYMSNYIPTAWFPGYNYVYLYKNSLTHGQYQKLVYLPAGKTALSTPLPVLESDYSMMPIAATHLDSNDIINKQYPHDAALITSNSIQVYTTPLIYYLTDLPITPDAAGVFYQTVTAVSPTTITGTNTSYTIALSPEEQGGGIDSSPFFTPRFGETITLAFTISPLNTGTGYINIGLYKPSDPIIAYFNIAEDGTSIYTDGPAFTPGAYSISITNDSTYTNNTTCTYKMYQQTTLVDTGTIPTGAYTMFIGGGGNTSAQTIRFVSCKMQSVTALKITDAQTAISSAKTTFDSASAALSVANAALVSATAEMDAKNVALNAANLALNSAVTNFMLISRSPTPPIYNGSTTGMDTASVAAQGAFNLAYNAQVDANTAFVYAQRVVSGEIIYTAGMTAINPTLTPAFNPSDTCVDTLGNTYIAEYNNNRVIKLDPLGIVTTIAFSATTALNIGPNAVITDSQNNLYIGTIGKNSTPGNYIYKITAASLATATPTLVIFAGKGTAATNINKYSSSIDTVNDNCVPTNVPFSFISSLAVDSQDNLYVADRNVPFIAKISGNIFSKLNRFTVFNLTMNNSVFYGYKPYNIVIDSQDNMYVAAKQSIIVLGAYKPLILKKENLSIEFTIFAGKGYTDLVNGNTGDDDLATSATFKSPVGVAVDNSGNVYVADDTSNVIRKIDVVTGIISRFIPEFTSPINIYFNKKTGNFYIIQTIGTTNTLIIADPRKFALNRTLVLQNAQSAQTAAQANVLNLQNNFKLLISSGNNIYFDGRYFIIYNNSRYDINLTTQNIYNTTNTIVFTNYFIINMASMSIITAIQAWHTSYIAALNTPFSLIDVKWSSKLSKDEPYQMMWFTALNNGMFGSGSYEALTKAFFPGSNLSVVSYNALSPPAPAVASVPFKTFNITNVTNQNKLFYSYVALWASPKVQTIPSSCLNKYWQTSWFPGYNYILIYQNSAGINQYQKISNYPTVPYGGTLPDLSMNLIAPTYNDPNVYGYKADEDTNGALANTINTVEVPSFTLNSPRAVCIDLTGNIYIADYNNKRVIRKTPSNTHKIITIPNEPIAIVTDSANNLYIATIGNFIYKVGAAAAAASLTISNTAAYIYAGTGVATTTTLGDGGAATAATFNGPYGLAVDSADNIYISDYANNRVRKISYTAGTITTVAGGGSGFTEGASATSVILYGPAGIVVDSLGSIYIGEFNGARIRKVTGTIITTFAGTGTSGYSGEGGLATSANITNPRSITLDSANNVYFTDYANNVIRKIDTTNIITTYISGLSYPGTIDFDNAGVLYIADSGNNRIVKILKTSITPAPTYTAATNPITTTMYSAIASATATTPGKDTLATLTTKFWPSGVGNTAGTPITSLSITSDYVKYQFWYAYVALNATPLNYPLNSLLPTYMNNYIPTTWFPGYNYVYLYKNNANNGQYQKLVNAPSTVKISTLTYMGNFNEKAYLNLNPTIASAVTSGTYVSGYQHWSTIGYKSDLKGTGMIVASNNNSPPLQTDIKLATSSDYGIMPIATTYIDTTDSINLLFQDDILDSSTTSNAIKNVVYGTHPDLVSNTFFPPNNAIGTPFVKFNILDLLSQYKFYYSYVASCVKPLTIKPFTYSILDADIGNYYATTWFPAYNYIYTYKNSRLNGQYQKLISLPVGKTATQLVSCDIGSHTAYATTHVDSNDPTNLYYQDEQMPTGVKIIKNKTFEVALNLIDCTYMYFSTNNTGYYIQDNTPYVADTRNDISGFQFIPSLFTTFSDKVLNLLSPLIIQGTTVATEMSNVYSNASTQTISSFSNVFSIAYPIPAVSIALDNTNTNAAKDVILTFTNPGSEAGYKVDIRDNNNPTNTASISIKKSSLLNNTYTISGLYPASYTFNISSSNSARYGISNIYTVYSSPNTKTFTYVAKTGPVVSISGVINQSNIIVSYPNAAQYNSYFATTYLDSYTGLVVTKTVNKDTTTFPDYTNNIISDLIPGRTYTFSNYSGYSALPLFNGILNISSITTNITATIPIRPIPVVTITSPASPSKTAKFTFTPAVWVATKSYETNYCITYTDTYGAHSCNTAPTSPGTTNTTTYTITGLVGGASYTFNVFSYYTIYNVAATGTPSPVMVSSLIKTLSPITIQAFENYVRPQEYKVNYVLIESSKPFSVPITIYDMRDLPVAHKVSKRENGVLLTLDTITEIAGFSFVPGKYDPVDFIIKGTQNGKDWIFNHKYKFNKYIDISPLFYFNGTTKKIKAVKQEIHKTQETPQFDIQMLQKYYKQKINPSIIPQYKSYMYAHDVVYFLYDEYDLNKKLVAADLVIGYVLKDGKVKKAILYEDEDGNSSGFDFSKKAVQRFWDTYIMVELNFASPVII